MSSGVTDWGAGALVEALLGIGPSIDGFWVGLLSDDAGPAMDGTTAADLEPGAGTGYARQFIGIGSGNWTYDSGEATNVADISFPIALLDWGRLADWGLFDSENGGNLYTWSELPAPIYASADWRVVLPAGAVAFGLTSLDPSFELT